MSLRTYLCGDLHLEFFRGDGRELVFETLPDAEAIVVAGDLNVAEDVPASLDLLAERYEHVIYVAGNHDYYHSMLERVDELRAGVTNPRVHWLEDSAVEVGGVRFVGSTLWFSSHETDLEHILSDFHCIAGLRGWVHDKSRRSLEYLHREVTAPSVVVTHHLPSRRSVVPRYEHDPTNCFFVCPEAEQVITERRPRLWVHGHSHDSLDYRIGPTRVVCNPYGYHAKQLNWAFKTDEMVVEL